jgi:hypothetical protein
MLFFITANIQEKIIPPLSMTIVDNIQKKGGTRDWAQAMANGALAGAVALYHGLGVVHRTGRGDLARTTDGYSRH